VNTKSFHPLPKDKENASASAAVEPRQEGTPRVRLNLRPATTWGGYSLPSDLIDKAVTRLGILGLLFAIAHPAIHYGLLAVIPRNLRSSFDFSNSFMFALWAAVGAGLIIFGLAYSRQLKPQLMLDIGLIFEVVGALLIGLQNTLMYPPEILAVVGLPIIGLWIVFCVLVVPNTLGKTALASFTSALMGPVALVIAGYARNYPAPPPFMFFVISFPNLLNAAFAIFLSRFVYNLGTDVSKAREMGSYKLIELLGRGGMGEVWRAQHRMLARPAAIKLIQPEVLGCTNSEGTAIVKRRFEREAQVTAMLSSPHTIDVYDFGLTEDGIFYYVMEYLHGIDLETLVQKYGPVPAERVVYFLHQICSSLDEAHRSGLVHRDIKPANIYTCRYGIEYDFVKVLDFGVVKSTEASAGRTQLTLAGAAAGTPGFMAPEMALAAKDLDGRADIYGVGCVAYWLLTGKLVFEEETPIATMLAHAQKQPVPPSRRTELSVPPQLERLIMSCLEKEPQRRPSSAGAIIRMLSQYGLNSSWTPDRAENWWRLHLPEKAKAGPELESKEPALQADAQTN
jgi:eukaryotic-like serine/threonine-protein kinase